MFEFKCAGLTGMVLGCEVSSCPSRDGTLVSGLATGGSAAAQQRFHCLIYLELQRTTCSLCNGYFSNQELHLFAH